MVVYICEKCQKKFNKKCDYEQHTNRKISCMTDDTVNENKSNNYCDVCNKYFSREDALSRHKNSVFHKENEYASKNNGTNNGNHNKVTNNNKLHNTKTNNNYITINNNYNNLCPFGQEEIKGLTVKDIQDIFNSAENPIIMLLIKTNLDPNKPQYHNIGIPDTKSATGYIYNGESWIKEQIMIIIDKLLYAKHKDLKTIHKMIKNVLDKEKDSNIQNQLDKIAKVIKKLTGIDVKNNKILISNIINYIYNNRELFVESKKQNPGKKISPTNIEGTKNGGFENLTDEYLEERLEYVHKCEQRLNLNKEIAIDLSNQLLASNKIDEPLMKLITERINETTETDILRIVINCLIKSICFGKEISDKIIDDNIEKNRVINEFFNNTLDNKIKI
ncbi:MAG: mg15 protein [Satyrvirus sp.]|uniref:Mg15 protein n=1 Tax=Satyrvirus sp. TaxID=2487771 RepID=A0A3G5AID3_9VIRU|nr:MAG: mg15 protein [Satyrvirus sp.]